MDWFDWDKSTLALMMWREARGQGTEGMRPCGHVAYNRARAEDKHIHVIITRKNQFTSINPPDNDPQLKKWPAQGDKQFLEAMMLAEGILSGSLEDNTGGATMYWNPFHATTGGWFDRNIAYQSDPYIPRTGWKFTTKIGEHYFYAPLPSA